MYIFELRQSRICAIIVSGSNGIVREVTEINIEDAILDGLSNQGVGWNIKCH